MSEFINEHKFSLILLSTSIIFLTTNIQRYYRLKTEYAHYERRGKMLHSMNVQKRDELDTILNHINQLLILEEKMTGSIRTDHPCVYDHGDHLLMPSIFSFDEDDEFDNDPLLQRLKLTKPTRLKSSSRQILNTSNIIINFTDTNLFDDIHTVYNEYLSE